MSQKVLTAQLRDMESNELVTRTVYPEVPPRVEYSLTTLGRSLKPILDAMWNWGESYKASVEQIKRRGQASGAACPFFCAGFMVQFSVPPAAWAL